MGILDRIRARLDPPSPEARATYADLKARWGRIRRGHKSGGCEGLTAENRPVAMKRIGRYFAAWSAFEAAWEDGHTDTTALSARVSELTAAEAELEAMGIHCNDGKPLAAPDVASQTIGLETADAVDQAAKDLGIPPNDLFPPWLKYAVGITAGVVILGQVASIVKVVRS